MKGITTPIILVSKDTTKTPRRRENTTVAS
jgi:hypothetical protein